MFSKPILAYMTLIISLVFRLEVIAQEIELPWRLDKSRLQFIVTPVLFKGYSYTGDVNNLLRRSASSSIEIGMSSTNKLYKQFYFSIGAIAGVVPEKTYYRFDTPNSSVFKFDNPEYSAPTLETKQKDHIYYYYSLPLSLKTQVANWGENFFYIETGVRVNWFLNYPFRVTYEDNYFIDSTNTANLFQKEVLQTKKIIASYFGKVALVKPLRDRNALGCAIVCNYAPKSITEGDYKFSNLGFDNFGKASLSMSYLGVEMSYWLKSRKIRNNKISSKQ